LALEGKKLHFFHSSIDHAAAYNLREYLEFYGHFVHTWMVDEKAQFNFEKLKKEIASCPSGTVFVNYTYVNNEVGVVWPLEDIKSLKDETGAYIHVDAVQSPGKVENWENILPELDFYTYSSHKFGGLKGIGFTFVSRAAPSIEPLLRGGGQQGGRRSGTLNTMGIISTKLALDDLKKNYKSQESFDSINFLRTKLRSLLGNKGRIIAYDAPYKNSNTIFFIIEGKDSNSLMMAFDLNQIDVGTGSACSSGILASNETLLNLGCSEKEAQSGIRLSFEPNLNLVKAKSYWEKIKRVLQKVLS
jgi:cysteine desulfurase